MSQRLYEQQRAFLQNFSISRISKETRSHPCELDTSTSTLERSCKEDNTNYNNYHKSQVKNCEKEDDDEVEEEEEYDVDEEDEGGDLVFQNYGELQEILKQILVNDQVSKQTRRACAEKLYEVSKKVKEVTSRSPTSVESEKEESVLDAGKAMKGPVDKVRVSKDRSRQGATNTNVNSHSAGRLRKPRLATQTGRRVRATGKNNNADEDMEEEVEEVKQDIIEKNKTKKNIKTSKKLVKNTKKKLGKLKEKMKKAGNARKVYGKKILELSKKAAKKSLKLTKRMGRSVSNSLVNFGKKMHRSVKEYKKKRAENKRKEMEEVSDVPLDTSVDTDETIV